MTRDVVTVTEDTDLGEVAALLEAKRIKRVPVMRDGKAVGIISRANLVRALGATKGASAGEGEADDRTIRGRLLAEFGREEWARVWPEDIIVRDGVVHFWLSSDESEEKKQALQVAAETIPGVRGVEEHVVPALHAAGSPGKPGTDCRKDRRVRRPARRVRPTNLSAAVGRKAPSPAELQAPFPYLDEALADVAMSKLITREDPYGRMAERGAPEVGSAIPCGLGYG